MRSISGHNMPRDQLCGLLCSKFVGFCLFATSYSWWQLNNGLDKSGVSVAFCLMVAFLRPYNTVHVVDYLVLSTPRTRQLSISFDCRKLVFARFYKGFLETIRIPGLVATGSWEPFLWLHFRLRKSKDLQGFSMVPRADPTRRQVSLKTPTGHRWHPTLQNHLFSQRL